MTGNYTMARACFRQAHDPHLWFANEGTLSSEASGTELLDYITGEPVRSTPEEVEAVQVFARRLVEDYGYPKSRIQTRPQFRVRIRPSDEGRSYPVDVAVFSSDQKTEGDLYLIVECKKRHRPEGLSQLKLYLDMSPAELGVWFNGEDHLYLRKILHPDGHRTYEQLPNIPRFGQRIEDIGLYRRQDLKVPSNLKATFRDIRNHLAGNVTGITRDESLAQEIIALLFCKIYDEVNTPPNEVVTFRSGHGEVPGAVEYRIQSLFEKVRQEYPDVFSLEESIHLDEASIVYVVGELQNFSVLEADRDAIGDAFEVFIGPALRGAEGQFFTPRNLVRMMISILDPKPGEAILDPACGSGGFLIAALEYVWHQVEADGKARGWSDVLIDRRKRDIASRYFRGVDKDSFLAKVTKAYMAIVGDGRGGVFCENSLRPQTEWQYSARDATPLETFDVVLTNPPFGSKIPVKGPGLLAQYDLAYGWKRNRSTSGFEKTLNLRPDQAPQLLFLERCLQFLKPGGRLGIVLPESILGNPSYEYVLAWLLRRSRLRAVVTLPEPLFKTSGKGGTHTKVCVLVLEKAGTPPDDYPIFMADAKWCGHDSRGNRTVRKDEFGNLTLLDDIPLVSDRYRQLVRLDQQIHADHLGFLTMLSQVTGTVLVPKYYDPEVKERLTRLRRTHELVRIGDLVADGVLQLTTGVEVGKMAYGTGPVPFVRTSDISNWELKIDPKHGVSVELYESLKTKLDIRPLDILMVRDGTYLIGTTAIVTKADTRMLFQSHMYKIRVVKPDRMDPWLLLACLNAPSVKRQIRAMQFTQDIIDTLGNRIADIHLALPRGRKDRERVAREVKEIVEARTALRERARQVALDVDGPEAGSDEDGELVDLP